MHMRFRLNLLEHTKAVGRWAQARGARAAVNTADVSLIVQRGERVLTLHPQFTGKRDGKRIMYFDNPDRHAVGFVGWLPYRPQCWPISTSKLAFKAAARELGLRTPAYWDHGAHVAHGAHGAEVNMSFPFPFLVKRARGAFGYGMRGPFAATTAGAITLAEGEYLEQFMWGRIARAWYWREQLAVLEVFAMPVVTGDGQRSYRDLLRARCTECPDDYADIAALQGVAPDDVVPTGRAVVCEYRYVSPLNPTLYANHNRLPELRGTRLAARFEEAGRRLWSKVVSQGVPQTVSPVAAAAPSGDAARVPQVGFVLDAIVDDEDQPWLLEINSNAQVHPDLYAPMLDALLPQEGAR